MGFQGKLAVWIRPFRESVPATCPNSVNRFATAGTAVDEHFEALFGTDAFKNAPASGKARHEYLRDL